MNGTVELTLPKGVNISDSELKMVVAAKLFDMGELSSGQAAEVAGITKREFLETVGKYGVSIFQYDAEELKEDLARLQGHADEVETSIDERKSIVDELRGIAAVPGKIPPTYEEWREERTNYLLEKYK